MEKDIAYNEYTADAVINRGYEIYDEWIINKLTSKKIVNQVENSISLLKKKNSKKASINALAYLFALDLRVKEKYNTLIKCLIFYFSWKREKSLLNVLKKTLRIPENEADIRTAIEINLKTLRQKLDADDADDDDETHGGKRNGKSDTDDAITEEKQQDQAAEESPKDVSDIEDAEETIEEKNEELSEEAPIEEQPEEVVEQEDVADVQPKETEVSAAYEQKPEQSAEHKDEIYGSIDDVEPSTNKKEEVRAYNDAVDISPVFEESAKDRPAEKLSFIDEVIIDNMIKGKEDFLRHNPVDDINKSKEAAFHAQDMASNQNEEIKRGDKDAYLYDKMIVNDKPLDKVDSTLPITEKVESVQPNNTTEQAFNQLNETHQSNNQDTAQENKIANELNATMSVESKIAYVRMQEDQMREQVKITLAELGIDEPIEIIGISAPDEVTQPSVTPNIK